MKEQYHILNGDALKEQMPEAINGEFIVMRECLVDGAVTLEDLTSFFQRRAAYLESNYGNFDIPDYFSEVVPEFEKMMAIPADAAVNLWFEDDLFCQVNFWFVVHLLKEYDKNIPIYLIRPTSNIQFGFGGLNQHDLQTIWENRSLLTRLDELTLLWRLYAERNHSGLMQLAEDLHADYPFILPAVKAYLESVPTTTNLGRPKEILRNIIRELQTEKFGPVFQEFNRRASIYGYGDLQVKRLFDELTET